MLKKRLKSYFNTILILVCLITLLKINSSAQEVKNKSNCYILADGKRIPLFSDLLFIKNTINISRDIEYPNPKIFLYGYDSKIRNVGKYIITPQILFYVDTAKKKTIREQVIYSIERRKEDGIMSKCDLNTILDLIRKYTIPFLLHSKNLEFGSSKTIDSNCYNYSIDVSKVKNEYPNNTLQQLTITVSIINHLVSPPE